MEANVMMSDVNNHNDNLARKFEPRTPEITKVRDVPGLDDSTMLDRFLSKLCGHIESEGLVSLYWVSGVHTKDIADRVLKVMSDALGESSFDGDTYVIVAKPGDAEMLEAFNSRYNFRILSMNEIYADSFIVVNESAVLDVTPIVGDDGNPEFSEDPTVVSLYTGLFNILKNGTTS